MMGTLSSENQVHLNSKWIINLKDLPQEEDHGEIREIEAIAQEETLSSRDLLAFSNVHRVDSKAMKDRLLILFFKKIVINILLNMRANNSRDHK